MASLSSTELLERELSEARAREAQHNGRLALRAALRDKLRAHAEAFQTLLRSAPPSHGHIAQTLRDVARISGPALDVARISVWLLDEDRTHLRCIVRLIDGSEQNAEGLIIDTSACPAYVHALSGSRALAVESVFRDPRTAELGAYCREHGIQALLDIPIVVSGALLGVIAHECLQEERVFCDEEIDFATSVATHIALSLETERRLTMAPTTHETEAKYRHLIESLPVTVYSFDFRTGKLDYVSPRVVERGGLSADRWLVDGVERWIERIHPDDRSLVSARYAETPGLPEEVTYRLRLDDETRWIRDTCRLVLDPLGQPVAIRGTLADVTDQTSTELERAELDRRIRIGLENAGLLAVMLDSGGAITFVNDHYLRVTGFSREALIGTDWFDNVSPPEESAQARRQYCNDLRDGQIVTGREAELPTKTGEDRKILWTSTVLRGPDGAPQGACFLGLDVTRQMQLEAELLQQTKLESLGRLAAGVAHDFNSLLAVMKLEATVLADSPANERQRAAHAALSSALDQAASLTRSLLVYGRKQRESSRPVRLDDLIRDTQALIKAIAGDATPATLSLDAVDARVSIDPGHFRQIVLNLVGNAVDAMRERDGTVRVATHLEFVDEARARQRGARGGGEFVVLTVADTGSGIDEHVLPRVFDPFFTTKEDGRGTGLGLPMCRSIVERASGFITVESARDVGTTFRVFLPRSAGDRPSVTAPSRPAVSRSGVVGVGRGASPLIVVVEDVGPIRDFVIHGLKSSGYRVLGAADLTSATHILASEAVDLLIADGSLPDGSGSVLARTARSVRPELRTLLMSGAPEDSIANFDAVLVKPFDLGALLAAVDAALGSGDSDEARSHASIV